MLECRKSAFDGLPGGCFDRRKKQRNYGELAKGTAALPDAIVENALP
jgi:hypothetical protein